MTEELIRVYYEERRKIKEFREKEIEKLNDERERLLNVYEDYKKNKESGRRLLQQTLECISSDGIIAFITESQHHAPVHPVFMRTIGQLLYQDPSCKKQMQILAHICVNMSWGSFFSARSENQQQKMYLNFFLVNHVVHLIHVSQLTLLNLSKMNL